MQCLGSGIRIRWIRDLDSLDPQDFDFLDPDPQKYADQRIRILGAKYLPKTAKKDYNQSSNLNCLKKRDFNIFLLSEWLSSLSEKNKTKKPLNSLLLNPNPDPHQNGMDNKHWIFGTPFKDFFRFRFVTGSRILRSWMEFQFMKAGGRSSSLSLQLPPSIGSHSLILRGWRRVIWRGRRMEDSCLSSRRPVLLLLSK